MNLSAQLSDLTTDRDNNFNLMRLGAASAVVLSHSFILSYNEPNSIPRGLGYLAVNCFFIMSGFLVCKSLIQRRSISNFYKARALRIYPALILAALFCVFVIGPLNTTGSLLDYFFNAETYQFLFKNSFLIFGIEYNLPLVFGSRGPERLVNAPIWTLVFEVYLYLFIGLLGALSLKKTGGDDRLFSILVIAFSWLAIALYIYNITLHDFQNKLLEHSVRFTALFGIGASFYTARRWVKLSPVILFVLISILAASIKLPIAHKTVLYPIIAYALLYLAYIPKGLLLRFNYLGDYSYGVYIFAYPIQQTIAHWHTNISTLVLFFSSFAISLLLAILSWHFIESRALRLKT